MKMSWIIILDGLKWRGRFRHEFIISVGLLMLCSMIWIYSPSCENLVKTVQTFYCLVACFVRNWKVRKFSKSVQSSWRGMFRAYLIVVTKERTTTQSFGFLIQAFRRPVSYEILNSKLWNCFMVIYNHSVDNCIRFRLAPAVEPQNHALRRITWLCILYVTRKSISQIIPESPLVMFLKMIVFNCIAHPICTSFFAWLARAPSELDRFSMKAEQFREITGRFLLNELGDPQFLIHKFKWHTVEYNISRF